MTSKIQVVIPMSGAGRRFLDAGYEEPKPLIDVAGRPMIARLIECFPADWRFVFVCSEEHLARTRLRETLECCAPGCVIVPIAPHKRGPVYAVLEAAVHIDEAMPTLVNYCDFSFAWDPAGFVRFAERSGCDGAAFCYRGFHPHYLGETTYAYCREEGGRILEVREKESFTDDRTREYALSGSHYFSSGGAALEYFRRSVAADRQLGGEFYVSLVYNEMIADGKDIRVYEIPFFLQWGTPEDLRDYLYWHRVFRRLAAGTPRAQSPEPRLLMPMAGRGSRFGEAYPPKPLIPVGDMPMFQQARAMLPAGYRPPVLVLRPELAPGVRAAAPDAELVVLDRPTQGQADTASAALESLALEEPVLVSACDHGLFWDEERWRGMTGARPDVIVVGQRGYPGARYAPRDFSYLKIGALDRITGVSVKEPISAAPVDDFVLVGTFLFKTAGLLGELIAELREKDLRVNGELYLDSVVGLAVERGLDVRCFEADAYLDWGSPGAYKTYSYWRRYFARKDAGT